MLESAPNVTPGCNGEIVRVMRCRCYHNLSGWSEHRGAWHRLSVYVRCHRLHSTGRVRCLRSSR